MRALTVTATFVAVLAMFAIGCTTRGHPIQIIEAVPIPSTSGKNYSTEELSERITQAGRKAGWIISADQPPRPGRLIGRYVRHIHIAVVDVVHDTKTYSIRYRETQNMHGDPGKGIVHQAYNEWVGALDKAIQDELSK